MATKGILKLFVDESGDPGVFSSHSPIYSVGFVALEPGVDFLDHERRFKERVSRLDGGEYFVHVGNIVRNEKPYKEVSPENRRKLFWNLFFFAMQSPIRISSVHCRKEGMNLENLPSSLNVRLGKELNSSNIGQVKELIDSCIKESRESAKITEARDETWCNIGKSSELTADFLIERLAEIEGRNVPAEKEEKA